MSALIIKFTLNMDNKGLMYKCPNIFIYINRKNQAWNGYYLHKNEEG